MDPDKKYPILMMMGVKYNIFDPYIKAGRYKPDEPEDLAETMSGVGGAGAIAGALGAFVPMFVHRSRAKKAVASGFPHLAPSRMKSTLLIPVSAFIFSFIAYRGYGAYATQDWGKRHPEYTTEQVLDKVTLFYALRDYAQDPNMARPPIHAEARGNVLAPPSKESERAANNAIAAGFRNESPFKTGK